MLLMTGGHERTEREYQMLFEASGYRLDRSSRPPVRYR